MQKKTVLSGNNDMVEHSKKTDGKQDGTITRRDFIAGAAAAAAFTIVPRHVLGGKGYTPPSEKLNIAAVGAGGFGAGNISRCSGETVNVVNRVVNGKNVPSYVVSFTGENIVALCDVDDQQAANTYQRYPKAKKYRDFRRMLEKQKDIDAVIVATPDHTHAVIAMMAMQMGKHVYVQKPLAHSIYETRMLTKAARKYKVVTQMGNQGHSGEGIRLLKEWIQAGAIGSVREVHCWTGRPKGYWIQAMPRPRGTPPIPPTLDWDLWLGPVPYRPYHPVYLPFRWRAWWDFGAGALGDMGCHIIDPPFWALELGHPTSVEASFTKLTLDSDYAKIHSETAPLSSIVRYDFPARGDKPAVKLTWWDGGLMPPRSEELEPGRQMGDSDGGCIFIGDKGKIMCGTYGKSPRLIPETKMKEYKLPPKTIPRVPEGIAGHEQDWIRACKGSKEACSNFDYSGLLTETVLLGNLAIRLDKKLYWDGQNMVVTNAPEAAEYINRPYRRGWSL